MKIIFLFSLLIQDVFLFVEGLLQACLVLLQTVLVILRHYVLVLLVDLLRERIVLDQSLLEQGSQSHALLCVGRDLVLALPVLAQLDILFQLLDLSLLRRIFELHLPILAFKLLDEERFQVVSLLRNWRVAPRMQKVHLLLQSPSQILNLFLLLLKIYVHLFGLGAESCVFIPRDIVLNLKIAVHIAYLFLFSLSEDRRLISLSNILIVYDTAVVELASSALHGANRHVASAGEQDIARAVIVDDLLIDSAPFGGGASLDPRARRYALVHRLDGHLVELAIIGRRLLPTAVALRRDHRPIKQLTV